MDVGVDVGGGSGEDGDGLGGGNEFATWRRGFGCGHDGCSMVGYVQRRVLSTRRRVPGLVYGLAGK